MMKASKKIGLFIVATFIALVALGCTNKVSEFSPEKVIDNALAESDDYESFYGESEITIGTTDENIETMNMKEWRDSGNVRLEIDSTDGKTISIYDGNQFIVFDEESNQAIVAQDDSFEFPQLSMKEQADILLELISESHETEIVGEEEIVGRNTIHMKAIQKNESALFGDQEIWIDKENWLVLKMISINGDMVSTAEYKEVDLNAEITEDLFVLDLSDDVEIIDSMELASAMDEVTDLDEVIEKIGEPFLYIPESDELSIDSIEFTDLGEQVNHKEANFIYNKNDEPYFDLAVILSGIGDDDLADIDVSGETVDIRGNDGDYFEMDDFRIVSWEENGLNYSIHLTSSDITIEDIQKIVEKMELVE